MLGSGPTNTALQELQISWGQTVSKKVIHSYWGLWMTHRHAGEGGNSIAAAQQEHGGHCTPQRLLFSTTFSEASCRRTGLALTDDVGEDAEEEEDEVSLSAPARPDDLLHMEC